MKLTDIKVKDGIASFIFDRPLDQGAFDVAAPFFRDAGFNNGFLTLPFQRAQHLLKDPKGVEALTGLFIAAQTKKDEEDADRRSDDEVLQIALLRRAGLSN